MRPTRKCPVCKVVDIPWDGRPMCHGCRKDKGVKWEPAKWAKDGLVPHG